MDADEVDGRSAGTAAEEPMEIFHEAALGDGVSGLQIRGCRTEGKRTKVIGRRWGGVLAVGANW